jgi:hypothetical protein
LKASATQRRRNTALCEALQCCGCSFNAVSSVGELSTSLPQDAPLQLGALRASGFRLHRRLRQRGHGVTRKVRVKTGGSALRCRTGPNANGRCRPGAQIRRARCHRIEAEQTFSDARASRPTR